MIQWLISSLKQLSGESMNQFLKICPVAKRAFPKVGMSDVVRWAYKSKKRQKGGEIEFLRMARLSLKRAAEGRNF